VVLPFGRGDVLVAAAARSQVGVRLRGGARAVPPAPPEPLQAVLGNGGQGMADVEGRTAVAGPARVRAPLLRPGDGPRSAGLSTVGLNLRVRRGAMGWRGPRDGATRRRECFR